MIWKHTLNFFALVPFAYVDLIDFDPVPNTKLIDYIMSCLCKCFGKAPTKLIISISSSIVYTYVHNTHGSVPHLDISVYLWWVFQLHLWSAAWRFGKSPMTYSRWNIHDSLRVNSVQVHYLQKYQTLLFWSKIYSFAKFCFWRFLYIPLPHEFGKVARCIIVSGLLLTMQINWD